MSIKDELDKARRASELVSLMEDRYNTVKTLYPLELDFNIVYQLSPLSDAPFDRDMLWPVSHIQVDILRYSVVGEIAFFRRMVVLDQNIVEVPLHVDFSERADALGQEAIEIIEPSLYIGLEVDEAEYAAADIKSFVRNLLEYVESIYHSGVELVKKKPYTIQAILDGYYFKGEKIGDLNTDPNDLEARIKTLSSNGDVLVGV